MQKTKTLAIVHLDKPWNEAQWQSISLVIEKVEV